MATNQTGIAIIIKAWLPVSGTIKEQIASLKIVETAHESGDYAELLKAASVEDIKTEQKTRRVEDVAATPPAAQEGDEAGEPGSSVGEGTETGDPAPSSPETSHSEPLPSADEQPAAPEPRRRRAAAE